MRKEITLFTYTLLSGGAEKQLVLLANTLSKEYKVTIIVYFDKTDDRIVKLINKSHIDIEFLRGSVFQKFRLLIKKLESNKTEYFFSYLTFPNLFGSLAAKYSGVPNIYSGIRTSYLPITKWIIECVVNRYIVKYTIFNNYTGEKNSQLFGLRKEKNIVISNYLEKIPNQFKRETANRIPTIVSVGRFVKEKDYKTALKSVSILAGRGLIFKYIIIGYGTLETEIRNLIKDFQLEEFVEIIIKPEDVYSCLFKSDIYLSTSLFEGTSNSILEAMNSKLPIVASNVGDNDYLIENAYNGFIVNKNDPSDISEKLEVLLMNSELRDLFGKNNMDVIKRKFSKEVFQKKYFALLK